MLSADKWLFFFFSSAPLLFPSYVVPCAGGRAAPAPRVPQRRAAGVSQEPHSRVGPLRAAHHPGHERLSGALTCCFAGCLSHAFSPAFGRFLHLCGALCRKLRCTDAHIPGDGVWVVCRGRAPVVTAPLRGCRRQQKGVQPAEGVSTCTPSPGPRVGVFTPPFPLCPVGCGDRRWRCCTTRGCAPKPSR